MAVWRNQEEGTAGAARLGDVDGGERFGAGADAVRVDEAGSARTDLAPAWLPARRDAASCARTQGKRCWRGGAVGMPREVLTSCATASGATEPGATESGAMNTVGEETGADAGAEAAGVDDTGGASADSCAFHSMPAQVGPPCSGGNGVRVDHSTGNGSRGPRGVEAGMLGGGAESVSEAGCSGSAPEPGELDGDPDAFIDCSDRASSVGAGLDSPTFTQGLTQTPVRSKSSATGSPPSPSPRRTRSPETMRSYRIKPHGIDT
jgi:hypothetical protein